jgi:aminopeptidase N
MKARRSCKRWRLAAIAAAALHAGVATTAAVAAGSGRLPAGVRPISYELTLQPDVTHLTFTGSSLVSLLVEQPTVRLELNAVDLHVQDVRVDGVAVAQVQIVPAAQKMIVTLLRPLSRGRHRLAYRFSGKIARGPSGLFRLDAPDGRGEVRQSLFTQLESADGRRLAPMWDEPAFKASFALRAVVPRGLMAVSNMPATSRRLVDTAHELVTFAATPPMSSYLLFLGVGNFVRQTGREGPTEVGLVTAPEEAAKGALAMRAARQLLLFYNDYFAFPYPLPKLDLVAGPGNSQSFSAMENWGALFYFQRAILVDPALTSESDRLQVYTTVAHEMAHQWFGNLVTMRWWDDLWLNEGFAEWMQTKAAEHFHPEWSPGLAAFDDREEALRLDAASGAHPVVQKIVDVENATEAFDQITYDKSAALIRMLEAYVGEKAWRNGIRRYVRAHAFGNTASADLWRVFASRDVAAIARDFTEQSGVPLIEVASVTCRDGNSTIVLRQSRFALEPDRTGERRWHVPVVLRTLGSTSTSRSLVIGSEPQSIATPGCGAVLVNAGQQGYFRTAYGDAAFRAVRAQLREAPPVDQLGLLSDAFALALSGQAPPSQYLALAERIDAASDPYVQRQLGRAFGELYGLYDPGPARDAFVAYAQERLRPFLAHVGFEPDIHETAPRSVLREQLLITLGSLGDSQVIEEARRRFEAWQVGRGTIPAAIRRAMLTVLAVNANAADWTALRTMARSSRDAMEKLELFPLLGAARNPELAQQALNLALSDEPPATVAPLIVSRVAVLHPRLAFAFTMAHLQPILSAIEPADRAQFLSSLMLSATDRAAAQQLTEACVRSASEEGCGVARAAAERIVFRSRVKQARLPLVDAWLRAPSSPVAPQMEGPQQ